MRLSVIVAILCVAGWMGAAQAQANANVSADQHAKVQGEFSQGHMPLIMSPDEKLIEGQVIDYKTVDMKNEKDHRVVQLKLRNGQTQEVDLGIKSNLPSGFDLNKGQWVLVAGIPGNLGNQQVFIAHRWANVYNLSATGSTTNMPKESLPGQDKDNSSNQSSGQGGSSNDNYKAHYGDFNRDRGQSAPANNNDQNKD